MTIPDQGVLNASHWPFFFDAISTHFERNRLCLGHSVRRLAPQVAQNRNPDWLCHSLDFNFGRPSDVQDAPETPATLGRQQVACGGEQDLPACEKCLVVGAYRRRPCPPALAALATHVAHAATSEASRLYVGGLPIPGLLHSTRRLLPSS